MSEGPEISDEMSFEFHISDEEITLEEACISEDDDAEPDSVSDKKWLVSSKQLSKLISICHWENCGKCFVEPANFNQK